jgi:predicted SAM-dependent methyltransferase
MFRWRAINAYMANHENRKLQIGTGPNLLKGWLNTDLILRAPGVVFLDAAKALPFNDSTFNCVFSEHQFETLTYSDGMSMLKECHRILKPGGRIRIATPSLEVLLDLRTKEKTDSQQRYIEWITDTYLPDAGSYRDAFVINNAFSDWGHKFIYDFETLEAILEETGFTNVTRCAPGESDADELRGIDRHGEAVMNERMNQFETMVIEAARPGSPEG